MMRAMRDPIRTVAVALALAACAETAPPPPPAPASASPAQRAALDEAWRTSVQYRSAHAALASNRDALARDVEKVRRMLATVEAPKHVPVAADPEADARAVEAALRDYLARKGLPGAAVEVRTRPAPELPPAEIPTDVGVEYRPEQIAGAHDVHLTLPDGLLNGPEVMAGLDGLDRFLVVTKVETLPDGRATLHGEVAYFRDLQPVRFVRKPVDVEAIVAGAGGERADEIRKNYAQVEALQPDLEASLAHQARLEIETGRFRFYKAWVERFNGQRWVDLVGRQPGP
jgi:hypothetical protein